MLWKHKFEHNTYFKFREYLGEHRNKTYLRKSRVYVDKGESTGRKTKKGRGAGLPHRRRSQSKCLVALRKLCEITGEWIILKTKEYLKNI